MHKGWKSRGRGSSDFVKILGGQGFPDKIARGSLILGLIAFLLIRLFKFALGAGAYVYTPASPHPSPVCIYEQKWETKPEKNADKDISFSCYNVTQSLIFYFRARTFLFLLFFIHLICISAFLKCAKFKRFQRTLRSST